MLGARLGERLLWIGAGEADLFAAVAAKVGLTGRAAAVSPDEAGRLRLESAAAEAGVLVDLEVAPGSLPFEAESFDLAVLAGPGNLLARLSGGASSVWLREAFRLLRPGGRFLVIERYGGRKILGILPVGGSRPTESASAEQALEEAGFRPVRTLAARQGLQFVEGIRQK